MSRASDVRDALKTELETLLSRTVDRFVIPRFTREELEAGPRVMVRVGGRNLSFDEGPDTTNVLIDVGVAGVTPNSSELETTFAEAEIDQCDSFDALMETVIALWMNDGPLSRAGIAEHFPVDITQVIPFDAQEFNNKGVYFTMIQITYRDSRDEDE